MMTCVACGTRVEDGATSCPWCGGPVRPAEQAGYQASWAGSGYGYEASQAGYQPPAYAAYTPAPAGTAASQAPPGPPVPAFDQGRAWGFSLRGALLFVLAALALLALGFTGLAAIAMGRTMGPWPLFLRALPAFVFALAGGILVGRGAALVLGLVVFVAAFWGGWLVAGAVGVVGIGVAKLVAAR